ncbi:hypothetical protein BD410DRAFT_803572 [Rickenella mellea]|uniref:Uncharacterized protein n=1 Tax=Rickenella mellea TaxID=50990 RepID=A0A4Y7Q543_9AGAM|nr:hypothetical protein BD410DRAFT_803572 [Rickenella mellea]
MKFFTVVSTALLVATGVHSASVFRGEAAISDVCEGSKVINQTYIGKDNNVLVEKLSCGDKDLRAAFSGSTGLSSRQTDPNNVCGAQCNTNCFTPSGGGPNPNDCHVIADALLFDSQNVGAIFQIGPAVNSSVITMSFRSCKTFMVDQTPNTLSYCRTDWSALVDFIAFNCQSTQNAHGGNCVAADQRWFVQIRLPKKPGFTIEVTPRAHIKHPSSNHELFMRRKCGTE